ncbi:hypothetical protein E2C01_016223 [Portunus trituberculatus]|uniref:Uncharacterized protein n=1 Tax=Portunus trituberculatus TaxID=210409 RepID=A0A5B7DQ75_PORTR|nr:hypothetical protein [Portunus trituberculatus]
MWYVGDQPRTHPPYFHYFLWENHVRLTNFRSKNNFDIPYPLLPDRNHSVDLGGDVRSFLNLPHLYNSVNEGYVSFVSNQVNCWIPQAYINFWQQCTPKKEQPQLQHRH